MLLPAVNFTRYRLIRKTLNSRINVVQALAPDRKKNCATVMGILTCVGDLQHLVSDVKSQGTL